MLYNYAVETYNYAYRQESRPADFIKVQAKIPVITRKAIALQNTAEANLLMCRYQLLQVNDLIDAYNAISENTPDKIKKKETLNEQINQRYEEVLKHAGNAYQLLDGRDNLTVTEKENLVMASRMLSDYWERKNDKAKKKIYDDRIRELE
jgi:glycyl-tRNA synthetase alpha subunit